METAGQLPPQAYWLAYGRWAGITPETKVVIVNSSRLVVPITEEDMRPIMERWTSPHPDNRWPHFRKEEIELHRVVGCDPVLEMGYGPETRMLVVRLVQ